MQGGGCAARSRPLACLTCRSPHLPAPLHKVAPTPCAPVQAAALIEELAGEVGSYRGYVNFLDTDAVGVGNWVDAFFGGAAPGLLCAARRFDPDNVFDQGALCMCVCL